MCLIRFKKRERVWPIYKLFKCCNYGETLLYFPSCFLPCVNYLFLSFELKHFAPRTLLVLGNSISTNFQKLQPKEKFWLIVEPILLLQNLYIHVHANNLTDNQFSIICYVPLIYKQIQGKITDFYVFSFLYFLNVIRN